MEKQQKIIQKAVHSNGYKIYYRHTNTYSNSNYYTTSHSDGNGSSHVNTSGGCNTWRESGWGDSWCEGALNYWRYTNDRSSYSQRYVQSDTRYSRYDESYREAFNTVNKSPTLSGAATPNGGTVGTSTITINLSGIGYADNEGNAATKYRIYYRYSSNNSTWGNYTLLSEQTSTTYSWNVSSLAVGYYQIAVTAYDGSSWSALLSSNTWTTDYQQLASNSGSASSSPQTVKVDTTSYDTISYALSSAFRLIKYTPPTWVGNPYTEDLHTQLQTEINTARASVGLTSYTFTNAPIVENFTIITLEDIQELQESSNAVNKSIKGTDYSFSVSLSDSDKNKTIKHGSAVEDIKNLLNNLSS